MMSLQFLAAKRVIQSLNYEELTLLRDEIESARTAFINKAHNLQLKAYLICMGIFNTEIVNVDATSHFGRLLIFTLDGCFKFERTLCHRKWYQLSTNPKKLSHHALDDIGAACHETAYTYAKYMLASDDDVKEWIAQHGDEWKKQNKLH